MDDQAFPNQNDTQNKVDDTLEHKVPEPTPPVNPPTPLTPPPSPLPQPEPESERSEEIKKPKSKKLGKAVKIVGGMLMLMLVVVGGITGTSMLQKRQSVESRAKNWNEGDAEITVGGKTMYVKGEDGKVHTYMIGNTKLGKELDANRTEGRVNFNLKDVDNYVNGQGVVDNTPGYADLINTTKGTNVAETIKEGLKATSGNGKDSEAPRDDQSVDLWIGEDKNKDGKIDKSDGANYKRVAYSEALALMLVYGTGQIDYGDGGEWNRVYIGDCNGPLCPTDEEEPPPGVPTSMSSPSPSPSYSCTSLAGDETYEYGETETFSCEANFSAVNPVAFFRYNVDGGIYNTSGAVVLTGTTASYDIPIDQYGAWGVQCKICTDSSETTCTTWGNAN